MTDTPQTGRLLTGRHVLMMFCAGFGLIIAVNVTMAFNAVSTFPGLEVPNSYIASQSFDSRRAAQEALGWEASATYQNGLLQVAVSDGSAAIDPRHLAGMIGRPTTRAADRKLALGPAGKMAIDLAPGRWRLDLTSQHEDVAFAQTLLIEVAE